MANLQIKGIEEGLYMQIKELAAAENRSVSQQILFLVKAHLAGRKQLQSAKTPARALLELSASWEDDRPSEEIVAEIKNARSGSRRQVEGIF